MIIYNVYIYTIHSITWFYGSQIYMGIKYSNYISIIKRIVRVSFSIMYSLILKVIRKIHTFVRKIQQINEQKFNKI